MFNLPGQFYHSTWDWISSLSDPTYAAQVIYRRFDFEHAIFKAGPKGLDNSYVNPWLTSPPPYSLAVIPRGRIWGPAGDVITPDNKLLLDLSYDHSIFHENRLPPVYYTPETLAVLTFMFGFNYGHWMLDVLPRFDLLRRSNIQVDRFVIEEPYLPKNGHTFQTETLALLGIPKEKLIATNRWTHIEAERLVVFPGCSIAHSGPIPKSICDYLRHEFLIKNGIQKITGNERIYISRADAASRKVLNEKEVIDILVRYGFKIVTLTQMSVLNKIQLFYSAEIIISPAGAALANLMFCNPGTKVIELFSPNFLVPWFYYLSNQVGLDYYYLIGERSHVVEQPIASNIIIDLNKLLWTLQMIGIA